MLDIIYMNFYVSRIESNTGFSSKKGAVFFVVSSTRNGKKRDTFNQKGTVMHLGLGLDIPAQSKTERGPALGLVQAYLWADP